MYAVLPRHVGQRIWRRGSLLEDENRILYTHANSGACPTRQLTINQGLLNSSSPNFFGPCVHPESP